MINPLLHGQSVINQLGINQYTNYKNVSGRGKGQSMGSQESFEGHGNGINLTVSSPYNDYSKLTLAEIRKMSI